MGAPEKMKRKAYEKELARLEIELVRLQQWIKTEGLRVVVSDPDEPAYFRTHVRFSTGAPRLIHLNDRIAVSTGERLYDAVHIHISEVL